MPKMNPLQGRFDQIQQYPSTGSFGDFHIKKLLLEQQLTAPESLFIRIFSTQILLLAIFKGHGCILTEFEKYIH